jgi:uncharacterized protein YoxC
MFNLDSQTIMLVFVAVTALAVLLQAFILLAIFLSVRKAVRSVHDEMDDLRSSIAPVVSTSRDLLARVGPRIEVVVDDLAAITHGLRQQSAVLESSANEVMNRVRRQSGRLDAMLTGVLDSVDRAGGFVANVVSKPIRQAAGLLAALKAIVESLRVSETQHRPAPASEYQPAGERPPARDKFV